MNKNEPQTDFGYTQVPLSEKVNHVRKVFSSVASKYDVMNDLMSLGLHRIWKHIAVSLAQIQPNAQILDLAGGTADLAIRMGKKLNDQGSVILADINKEMLTIGRDKVVDAGLWKTIKPVQANAESLPFPTDHFDIVTIAFGLRNVTDKMAAIKEMYRVLKPGGQILILEFSQVKSEWLRSLYDTYSFQVLPKLGKWVANDEGSYRYLAESIRKHPNQQTLLEMMQEAQFEQCHVHNFLNGIVALHRGYKL